MNSFKPYIPEIGLLVLIVYRWEKWGTEVV